MQVCQKNIYYSGDGYVAHLEKKHGGKYTYTYLELDSPPPGVPKKILFWRWIRGPCNKGTRW